MDTELEQVNKMMTHSKSPNHIPQTKAYSNGDNLTSVFKQSGTQKVKNLP